jgi:hypothetical protein
MPRKGGLGSTLLHLYKPLPRNGLFQIFEPTKPLVEAVVSWTAHTALADRYRLFLLTREAPTTAPAERYPRRATNVSRPSW